MSVLFNMLSRLVIAFLPRRKHLLISWLQSSSVVVLKTTKIIFDLNASKIDAEAETPVLWPPDMKKGLI